MAREERSLFEEKLKTKKKYFLEINGKNTGYLVREIFNNRKTYRWYPFYYITGEARPKQKYSKIEFIGTDYGKIPQTGFTANLSKGYGFTKPQGVDSFFRFLENNTLPDVKAVIFTQNKTEFNSGTLYLNSKDFARIRAKTKSLSESASAEEKQLHKKLLCEVLPGQIEPPGKIIYMPGSLERFMSKYAEDSIQLSKEDADLVIQNLDLEKQALLSTKKEVDRIYIEDVVTEFKNLMSQKTETDHLEEEWHQFFKKHPWIFTNVFAYPATYFKDKLNVGGHDLSGGTDKIVDFLAKNKLTHNVSFVEIKTHKTPLMQTRPYRKPSVYAVSSHVTGSIVQVIDQKTTFLKNFNALKGASDIESLNSNCLIIVGSINSLSDRDRKNSFELFRMSNKEVVIVTFDELQEKMEALLALFTK